jgi:hypothetical protein
MTAEEVVERVGIAGPGSREEPRRRFGGGPGSGRRVTGG